MNRPEALAILNLEEPFEPLELLDAYQQGVFDQISYFMQNIPHKMLVRGRVKKLRDIEDAYFLLGGLKGEDFEPAPVDLDYMPLNLIDLLRYYEKEMSRMRKYLATIRTARASMRGIELLNDIQEHYEMQFFRFIWFKPGEEDEITKISQGDTAAMIRLLNEHGYDAIEAAENVHLHKPFREEWARIMRKNNVK